MIPVASLRLLIVSDPTGASKFSPLIDRPDSYGWISIALHWLVAAIVIAMWFIGKSISGQPPDEIDATRNLHVTIGLSAWLLIFGRIVWRLVIPHPRAHGQTQRTHKLARAVHYLMLAALSVMLLSGPLLAWLSPGGSHFAGAVRAVHASAGNFLFLLLVVHILGALKHLMFHDDETIERMLWPRKPDLN